MSKICIDAGHYSDYNKCPAIPSYSEAKCMYDLHLLEKKYLEKLGHTVIITRDNQEKDMPLYDRGMMAKGCDLFMSDHTNAVGSNMNEFVDYAVVYHLYEDAALTCDDKSKEIASVLAKVIADTMGTKQSHKIASRRSDRDKDGDGVLDDNYLGVLHGARMAGVPAVLCEHSFHTNSEVVMWLMKEGNLDLLARNKALAIHKYLTGKEGAFEDVKDDTEKKPLYRVQVGAFEVYQNAVNLLENVKKIVSDAFITMVGNLYKVQVGAYSNETYAENMVTTMKNAGYTDAFITTNSGLYVTSAVPKKSIEEVAKEVINGLWGNGEERMKSLEQAGYNYDEVQDVVNKLVKNVSDTKTIEQIVREVINGKWGNGEERKKKLTEAGYDYETIRKAVNKAAK